MQQHNTHVHTFSCLAFSMQLTHESLNWNAIFFSEHNTQTIYWMGIWVKIPVLISTILVCTMGEWFFTWHNRTKCCYHFDCQQEWLAFVDNRINVFFSLSRAHISVFTGLVTVALFSTMALTSTGYLSRWILFEMI